MIFDSFGDILIVFALLIPAAALIWFILSLIFFLIRPKGTPARKFWRLHMIISGIVAFVTIGGLLSFAALFILALAGM